MSLIEINYEEAFEIEFQKAANSRGNYVLNKTYSVDSNTPILKSSMKFKDDEIWRPNKTKFIPRMSNISAPFKLFKNQRSATLKVFKA